MEYLTETRGDYDEWSDSYEAITGVRLEDGTELPRFIDDIFTDTDGNPLEVEFPQRDTISGSPIYVERYDPDYENWTFESLSSFEEQVDEDSRTVEV